MNQDIQKFLRRLDNSLLLVRGVYADWAKKYGVSYNGMAVLYYMDGFGGCTQKQLSEEFLIPKQTVNNIVKKLLAAGYIRECPKGGGWREKQLELTEEGKVHTDEMMGGLFHAEEVAARRLGRVQLTEMVDTMERYGKVLKEECEKCRMDQKAKEAVAEKDGMEKLAAEKGGMEKLVAEKDSIEKPATEKDRMEKPAADVDRTKERRPDNCEPEGQNSEVQS